MKSPLLWTGILLILVLTTALIGPYFVDWNAYRDQIARYAEQVTGREVTLDGPLAVRLLPFPVIKAANVRIANPEGAHSRTFMVAQRLDMRLLLPPLLRGKVAIDEIRLVRPQFNLERMEDGGWSWVVATGWDERFARLPLAEDISVEALIVEDGVAILRDAARGGVARLDNIDLRVSAASLVGPYRASGRASYGQEQLEITLSSGRYRAGAALPVMLRVQTAGRGAITYHFNGEVGVADVGGIQGSLTISRGLDVISAERGQATQREDAERPFLFSARLAAVDDRRFRLNDIEIAIDDPTNLAKQISGEAEFTLADRIALDARLGVSRLVVSDLLGEDIPPDITPAVILETMGTIAEALPDDLGASLSFEATFLETRGERIENFRLISTFDRGNLNIEEISGTAPGRARVAVSASYRGASDPPHLSGRFDVTANAGGRFIDWLIPAAQKWFNTAAARTTRLSAEGVFGFSPQRMLLDDVVFALGDAEGRARVSHTQGGRDSWNFRLEADRVDLDTYLRQPAAADRDETRLGDALHSALDDIDLGWFDETDVRVVVQLGELRYRSVDAVDIALDAAMIDGTLDLRTLEIGDVGSAKITASGLLRSLSRKPEGSLAAGFEAENPREFLRLIGAEGPPSGDVRFLAEWPQRLGATRLDGLIDARTVHDATHLRVSLQGLVNEAEILANATYSGLVSMPEEADFEISASAESIDGGNILRLLGLERATSRYPGRLRLDMSGRWSDLVDGRLRADLLNARGDATVRFRPADDLGEFVGHLNLEAARSDELLALVGVGELEADMAGPISAEAEFGGFGARADVVEVNVRSSQGEWRYRGKAEWSSDTRMIAGDVVAPNLSVPWLFGFVAFPVVETGTPFEFEDYGADGIWPAAPFRFGRFDGFSVNVNVAVDELELLNSEVMRNATLALEIGDGRLAVRGLSGSMLGGQGRFDLLAEDQGWEMGIRATLALDAIETARLLKVAGETPALEGSASLAFDLSARGRSPAGLMASIAGSGSYRLEEGTLHGVSPADFSLALMRIQSPGDLDRLIQGGLEGGTMSFTGGEGTVRIDGGVMHLSPIPVTAMAAGGTAEGFYDVADDRLDASFRLRLTEIAGQPELELALTGSPADLSRSFDTAGLRANLTVQVLEESIERLEELQREQERILEGEISEIDLREAARRAARMYRGRAEPAMPHAVIGGPAARHATDEAETRDGFEEVPTHRALREADRRRTTERAGEPVIRQTESERATDETQRHREVIDEAGAYSRLETPEASEEIEEAARRRPIEEAQPRADADEAVPHSARAVEGEVESEAVGAMPVLEAPAPVAPSGTGIVVMSLEEPVPVIDAERRLSREVPAFDRADVLSPSPPLLEVRPEEGPVRIIQEIRTVDEVPMAEPDQAIEDDLEVVESRERPLEFIQRLFQRNEPRPVEPREQAPVQGGSPNFGRDPASWNRLDGTR